MPERKAPSRHVAVYKFKIEGVIPVDATDPDAIMKAIEAVKSGSSAIKGAKLLEVKGTFGRSPI